jgi:hypothetical protein
MRYAPKSLEGEFSEAHITRASYVEYRRSVTLVHKTLIIPARIMAPSQARLSGPGRWGRRNFAKTVFSEVRGPFHETFTRELVHPGDVSPPRTVYAVPLHSRREAQ